MIIFASSNKNNIRTMETVFGIYEGKPAKFEVIKKPIYSKKKRLLGHEITYNYIDNRVQDNDVFIDTSINAIMPFKDISLNLITPAIDYTIFNFGKYKGTKIMDCDDIDYLRWYYEINYQKLPYELCKQIRDKIMEKYFMYDQKFYPIDYNMTDEDNEILNSIKNKGVCKFKYNLNEKGKCLSFNGIIIKFENYKTMMFGGKSYSMPQLDNGHYIKIKNKTIKFKEYNVEFDSSINRWIVNVYKFDILTKGDDNDSSPSSIILE